MRAHEDDRLRAQNLLLDLQLPFERREFTLEGRPLRAQAAALLAELVLERPLCPLRPLLLREELFRHCGDLPPQPDPWMDHEYQVGGLKPRDVT